MPRSKHNVAPSMAIVFYDVSPCFTSVHNVLEYFAIFFWEFHIVLLVFHNVLWVFHNVLQVFMMFYECFTMFYECFTMFYDVLVVAWPLTIAALATTRLPIAAAIALRDIDPMLNSILIGVSNNSVPGWQFPDWPAGIHIAPAGIENIHRTRDHTCRSCLQHTDPV